MADGIKPSQKEENQGGVLSIRSQGVQVSNVKGKNKIKQNPKDVKLSICH